MKEYFSGLVRTNSNIWEKVDKNTFNNSIVFIEDTRKIYSNGVYYNNDFECEKILFETENITLQPNKFYYNPNAISSLDISLDFEEDVSNTYFVEFIGNNISLLLPSYIRWENDIIPDFSKPYYKYTMKIQDDVAYVIDKTLDESLMPNYFYIESLENGNNINLGSSTWLYTKRSQVEYSIDKMNWKSLNIASYTLNKGEKMYFRCIEGNIEKNSNNSQQLLIPSKIFNVGGDMSTVIYGEENVQTINNEYAMNCLFYNTKIVDASKLLLPATELANWCYYRMFCNCTSLTTAPELPATELANRCYNMMFYGCTSLTIAPELPATTLTDSCYSSMFYGCTSLTIAPELPVTTLAESCYLNMFYGCTSLTTAPELPATTLADHCYSSMFYNCTSLTVAPELPATTLTDSCYSNMFSSCTKLSTTPELLATTLADYCYNSMFKGCTSLTTVPKILPATTLAESCYGYMFYGCTKLSTAPELPATTLTDYCYISMFSGCASLNEIKCLATDMSATDCLTNWTNQVSYTGTFYKHTDATWPTGVSGIPSTWKVVNAEN